jgi:regulator of sigma E protease
MTDTILAIAAFFVVLIPLILVHELGHFLAAKRVGITILEFAIGFPPRIKKLFTWGETEFTINWIPLGGYVRPLGEDMVRPLDEKATEEERASLLARREQESLNEPSDVAEARSRGVLNPKTVNEIKPLPRIFFMAGGALANFVLAFLLFFIVAVTGLPQPIGGTVGVVATGTDAALVASGLQSGDLVTDVNGAKFSDSSTLIDLLYTTTENATLTVQRGETGEQVDIVIPPLSAAREPLQRLTLIAGTVPGAPGDAAGIQPGDLVEAFNGELLNNTEDFRARTRENVGREITLTLRRGDEVFDVSLTPRTNPPEGQGAIGIAINAVLRDPGTGLIFIDGAVQEEIVPLPLIDSLRYSVQRIVEVISLTVRLPAQLLSGAVTAEEARPVSVVGMSQIGGFVLQQSIDQGRFSPILDFIAVISVALGFFNLLPIPALDGGRILFVLVEIVRGRPIAPEREGLVHLVGLALLLSLSVLVILNDVINPITNVLR